MAESKFENQEKQRLNLTAQDLRSGKLVELLPEFYELKDSVENSKDGWHQQESVLDHTLSVMDGLEKTFKDNKNLEIVFSKKIDGYTRKELLEIATALHDIGKKEAMVQEGGFTKCSGHEKISVEKTKIILERFNLSAEETQLVLDIIANHSVFHYLLMPDNQNFAKDLQDLRSKFGESIYPELIVLSYADTINSKLRIACPEEFKNRIDFYQAEIRKL
ncbi:MAG: hypothetical protein A2528_01165 [Candidatus Staskawiczbacteria bacterium RIFOXYD2_FULL_37_9]|uniref:HD domain-containing protein n=1 Tax=Candidatus Staskawiczbacteria bacterium RIFOXYB1_FULL_37_44 TaxID=1802223 RepID=A0A1G2IWC8_9BACT|nr:MAG: hypothetical protein A2358_04630 [Candidatus Staskawiczbacteria bacterium RIFOXYB1_FULL_37_44]OGZ83991.1 MAG: hypothetical protein A2416_04460 [Candidatus Staskawiczbacteria bacterium RIFOXYC1_FULL_37_52]OGZ89561.1 MAG: hypothetical protein A2581_03840 [Candidatus Staskawiczbacteria bacterium RIFOXYD1_FULL_37_110]OGZ89698.1 MAG: hypothetical protein A2444_01310 [Candidatus Staskawiczbacteria bacterium RIFOXYC2_FULL_37_19]OGZ92921.1 MAG: hypothetical protein A2528_01165 [Candidatus Stask